MIVASLAALTAAHGNQSRTPQGKITIGELGWISGAWVQRTEKTSVEEHWTHAAGGTMFGVSRTVAGGKTVAFEFLRIEERADGIYYVAQPGGRAATNFKLTQLDERKAVFENPTHDFPKRILYWRNPDGSLTARIDGGAASPKAQEFPFRPLGK
jgi:hypothetical protein